MHLTGSAAGLEGGGEWRKMKGRDGTGGEERRQKGNSYTREGRKQKACVYICSIAVILEGDGGS